METAVTTITPPVKLNFMDVAQAGIKVGIKNAVPLLLAVVFWVLTVWIPYLNIGTTIAIATIPMALARGETITPAFIFDKKYRQFMGEFSLTLGFMTVGMLGLAFTLVGPIIIGLAWSQALFLVLDKRMSPTDAMIQSNKMMDGNKWIVFGLNAAVVFAFSILSKVLGMIFGWIHLGFLIPIVFIAAMIAQVFCQLGIAGVVYGKLTGQMVDVSDTPDETLTETPAETPAE